ncbi:MAG: hypothetical protein IJQ08_08040 [Synergistaceae bacterium]|nr:hypothetical protein [Synergistaceae bacterium]MBR0168609.1 hypothetical protein [Synergistaceae bacterium]
MLVNLIVDTSAGFKSDGKANLQRNTVRSIMSAASKAKYADCKMKCFTWSDSLVEANSPDEIKFYDSVNVSSLEEFIEDSEENSRFLLLSDGLFDPENIDDILCAKKSALVPVAVGADSDVSVLTQIAAPNHYCFKCVNVLAALFEICFRDFYSCNGGFQ